MVFIPNWGKYKSKKPTGRVQVNWNNPISNGLMFVAGFGDRDLISGIVPTFNSDVSIRDGSFIFNSRTSTNPGVVYGDICDYATDGLTQTVITKSNNWTSYDGAGNVYGLVSKSEASANSGRYAIAGDNGNLKGIIHETGGQKICSAAISGLLINGKTHIISSSSNAQASSTDYLFVDGKQVASVSTPDLGAIVNSSINLRLGGYAANNATYYGRFIGEIHLAMLHSRPLSYAEEFDLAIYPYQLFKSEPRIFSLSAADVTGPVISSISASGISAVGATITWTTDEGSDSVVEYGLTTGYGASSSDASMVTSHSRTLDGLTAETLYHYRVKSTDASANESISSDQTFTTAAASSGSTTIYLGLLGAG